ncbi:MAG: stage II sporulation protein M [Bacillota bacterium]
MLQLFMPAGQVIKQNRSWLILAILIFLISGAFFYTAALFNQEPLGQLIGAQSEQLQGLITLILESNPLIAVLMIFLNNFISISQMLLLGVLAGVSPLITLSFNGALVGFFAALAAAQGTPLLPLILLGILPHGVFELFALFLCGALGLKFGYHCLAAPLAGKTRLQSFKHIWKETISVLPLVVLLLLAAAFIEILITPRLLGLIH